MREVWKSEYIYQPFSFWSLCWLWSAAVFLKCDSATGFCFAGYESAVWEQGRSLHHWDWCQLKGKFTCNLQWPGERQEVKVKSISTAHLKFVLPKVLHKQTPRNKSLMNHTAEKIKQPVWSCPITCHCSLTDVRWGVAFNVEGAGRVSRAAQRLCGRGTSVH